MTTDPRTTRDGIGQSASRLPRRALVLGAVAAAAAALFLADVGTGSPAAATDTAPDAATSSPPALDTARPAPTQLARAMAAAAVRAGPRAGSPAASASAPTQAPAPRPEPTSVPAEGPGTFSWAPGSDPAEGPGRTLRYRVEVEDGLPFDPAHVARVVHTTLTDDRGWQPLRDVAFERTPIDAELRVLLATPATTDRLCLPLDTGGEVSCRVGDRVVLNAKRWAEGVPHFNGALHQYRQYLVNHEVGHALGHGHVDCPAAGEPAPVMMQQTKSVGACVPNAWPSISGG